MKIVTKKFWGSKESKKRAFNNRRKERKLNEVIFLLKTAFLHLIPKGKKRKKVYFDQTKYIKKQLEERKSYEDLESLWICIMIR